VAPRMHSPNPSLANFISALLNAAAKSAVSLQA
jgi:hypothetical protein